MKPSHLPNSRRRLFTAAVLLSALLVPFAPLQTAGAAEGRPSACVISSQADDPSPQSEPIDYRVSSRTSLIVYVEQPPRSESYQEAVTVEADLRGRHDDGFKPIGAVGADIRPGVGEMPANYAAARFADVGEIRQGVGASRDWQPSGFNWESKALCHRSLLFEEVNLERHGYALGPLQPVVSAAHFFATVPLLPYKITAERARQCHYTLGHYRPGSYAPFRYNRTPFRPGAVLVEGVVVTGLSFLIP